MITETWLSSNIYDSEIVANDYHIYCCDQAGKGGGVLIAILKHLQSRHLPTHPLLEAVMVQIESRTVVLCVYVPPNCSDDYFNQLIKCNA